MSHLLAATSNVIITDIVEVGFLVFTLDGITLSVDDGVLGDDTELGRVGLNDLELDCSHTTANEESVALSDGAVS